MYCLAILRSWKRKNADNRFSFQCFLSVQACIPHKENLSCQDSRHEVSTQKNAGELKPSLWSARSAKRLSRKQVSHPDHFKWVSFNTQEKKTLKTLNDISQGNVTCQHEIAMTLQSSSNLTIWVVCTVNHEEIYLKRKVSTDHNFNSFSTVIQFSLLPWAQNRIFISKYF